MPRRLRVVLHVALFCASMFGFSVLPGTANPDGRGDFVASVEMIALNDVDVWPEPGYAQPALERLESGASIKALDHHRGGKWLEIAYNGKRGYIMARPGDFRIIHKKTNTGSREPSGPKNSLEIVEDQAEKIADEIKKSMDKVDEFNMRETSIIDYLNRTDRDIYFLRGKVEGIKSELSNLKKKIVLERKTFEILKQKLDISEKYATARLVALYKFNCLGSLRMMASSESLNEFFQQKMAIQRLLANDERAMENFVRDKKRVLKALDQFNGQKKKKRDLEYSLSNEIVEILHSKGRKTSLLEKIRMEKAYHIASVKSLNMAATDLSAKIKSFKLNKRKAASEEGAEKMGFTAHKGLLEMPVKGKIINRFGLYKSTEFNIENFRRGIDIKSDMGEPIHAVFQGRVLYSKWFKGYGNIIIIDHGAGYYTLYAHLEKLHKKKGDGVRTGEVIATVGDSGSIVGAALYFEVRHHGKPIDPMQWIKRG